MTAKIKTISIATASLAIGLIAAANTESTISDRTFGGFRSIAVVDSEALTIPGIQRLAKKLNGDSYHIFILSVFKDEDAAALNIFGKGHTEVSYGDAISQWRAAQRTRVKMTRLVSVYGNTVVQAVDGPNTSRQVIGGHDPLLFEAAERQCQILEVYFARPPRPIRKDRVNPTIVKIYMKVDSLPNIAEAETISKSIEERFHHNNLAVHIRCDSWFLEDSDFPPSYPFAPTSKPPSLQEFRARGDVSCSANDEGIRCRRF